MPDIDSQSIEDEQRYRASAYALLAALLRAAPDQALLESCGCALSPAGDAPSEDQGDDLGEAMASLAAASARSGSGLSWNRSTMTCLSALARVKSCPTAPGI